jgi:hypothetical protein
VKKRRGRREMRSAWGVSRAVPLSVPLKADAVGPCRLTFGYLSVAGADEESRSPADNALFFETAEGRLGRVTFEGLDATVRPVRSANSRVATLRACATTPTPSPVTDRPVDPGVRFTYGVPSTWGPGTISKSKNPKQDRHFRASTRRSRRGAVNDPG